MYLDDVKLELSKIKSSKNLAVELTDEQLVALGEQVHKGYIFDKDSREDWEQRTAAIKEISQENMEEKYRNGHRVSNVKYPLIMESCIEFSSRLYPQIVAGDKAVKTAVIGSDMEDIKLKRSTNAAKFMNAYLLQVDDEFNKVIDKLIHMYPFLGLVYLKTYFDPICQRVKYVVCLPEKIIINENVQCLEKARRISYIADVYWQDIKSMVNKGLFVDVSKEDLMIQETEDPDPQICLIEQDCWCDLDGDGFPEPYIITIEEKSKKVLNIVHRIEDISKAPDGKIVEIEPQTRYIDFHCIPSPDGKFHSYGLGSLLLPINGSINTILNQLIDSGAIHNNQSGFIGSSLKLRNQDLIFDRNEWKVVNDAYGDGLANKIIPLPTKEPSQTLFALLQMLIQAGKDLVSVTDTLKGKNQTQNVPATTQLSTLEQSLQLHDAIKKRFFESLTRTYKVIYRLISQNVTQKYYAKIMDSQEAILKDDFNIDEFDVIPVADPSKSSVAQRTMKAQAVMQMPGGDNQAKIMYLLESMQFTPEEIQKLYPPPDPQAPPPPDIQKTLSEVSLNQAKTMEIAERLKLEQGEQLLRAKKQDKDSEEADSRIAESGYRSLKMMKDSEHNIKKLEADVELELVNKIYGRDKDAADALIKAETAKAKNTQSNKQ